MKGGGQSWKEEKGRVREKGLRNVTMLSDSCAYGRRRVLDASISISDLCMFQPFNSIPQ